MTAVTTTTLKRKDQTIELIATWAVLVGLTLASWWFSDNHGWGPFTAITAILVLTFVKVFMVGHSFMELRHAPRLLKTVFASWCVGICAILVVLAFTL